jgi:hypothetical protein
MPQPTNTPVPVSVRLPAEDLLEYRLMALEAGKSLSAYIREILRAYAARRKRRKREGFSP